MVARNATTERSNQLGAHSIHQQCHQVSHVLPNRVLPGDIKQEVAIPCCEPILSYVCWAQTLIFVRCGSVDGGVQWDSEFCGLHPIIYHLVNDSEINTAECILSVQSWVVQTGQQGACRSKRHRQNSLDRPSGCGAYDFESRFRLRAACMSVIRRHLASWQE